MATPDEITRALDACAADEYTTVDGSAREIVHEALAGLESERVMETVLSLVKECKELAEADDRFWVTNKDARVAVAAWQEREADRLAAEDGGADEGASPDAADG